MLLSINQMGLGAKPPKFYKIIFKFLSFVKILIEISSYFNFPIGLVGGGGQTDWWGRGRSPQTPMVATALQVLS